jgi:hypothetical protein
MKNMLLAYFNTSEHKRSEVVGVLGHILNFSEEEINKVGTGSQPPQATGWFSGLLSFSGSNQSQQHDKVHFLKPVSKVVANVFTFYNWVSLSDIVQSMVVNLQLFKLFSLYVV